MDRQMNRLTDGLVGLIGWMDWLHELNGSVG